MDDTDNSNPEGAPAGRRSVNDAAKRTFPLPALIAAAVVLAVLLILLGRFCSSASTINVTVNNNPLALHGSKTISSAIYESGLPINPGDFISLGGTVLEDGGGHPFYATVNGQETTDGNFGLHEGDNIFISDGKDIVEDYDSTEETLPCDIAVVGVGAICTFEEGKPCIVEHRTGRVSGDKTDHVLQNSETARAVWHRPDVGNDKAIALTFDEGPSSYTSEILDILEENDVQATFFCQGSEVGSNVDTVKREWNTRNQIGSNTYSRDVDEGSTENEVREEVDLGFRAISEALEGKEIKRVVRFPGTLLTAEMASAIYEDVDAVIGWDFTIDEASASDAEKVYESLMNVRSGEIVMLQDGGGNCSATVEALRRALPKLKDRGFTFVTIDRLMGYPAKKE